MEMINHTLENSETCQDKTLIQPKKFIAVVYRQLILTWSGKTLVQTQKWSSIIL